ncbi:hypothetical protein EUGRSUZ_B01509 [Eucalyptus grandis]|uniref:Uncharacterized protein n=2 Tax=Eucalyptus grandis TaxID=71139 RepID=A0ACC3LS82_EUCGR|nr:hypothetical protein EUGRSUZ_B01509 [Eucalyptus grandis]
MPSSSSLNHGLTTETNYPYERVDGTCNARKEASHAAKILRYEDVPSKSESALLKAVAHQLVSITINAGDSAFQIYKGIWMPRKVFCGIAMEASYPTA